MMRRLLLGAMLGAAAGMVAEAQVCPAPSTSWGHFLYEGGLLRTRRAPASDDERVAAFFGARMPREGRWYLSMDDGLTGLVQANYVDGYSFGPHLTLGHIDGRGRRWEIEEDVRWASSRHVWLAHGTLRCVLPPEWATTLEVYGGRMTVGFDSEPMMPHRHSLLAAGLFGWDKEKLYQSTKAGAHADLPLGRDLRLDATLYWEKCERMVNHRRRNLFGVRSEGNIPLVSGHPREQWEQDPFLAFDDDDRLHPNLALSLSWWPHQTLSIASDMESSIESPWPKFTMGTTWGVDDDVLQIELRAEQDAASWSYMVSAGVYPLHTEAALMDRHHFDASRFPWQTQRSVSWLSLLNDYELSTDRGWAEAHVEYRSQALLLSRLSGSSHFGEYVQCHWLMSMVDAAPCTLRREARTHVEVSYGWDFGPWARLGLSLGWTGGTWRGVGLNLVLDTDAMR